MCGIPALEKEFLVHLLYYFRTLFWLVWF
jgi:hypothetical protein